MKKFAKTVLACTLFVGLSFGSTTAALADTSYEVPVSMQQASRPERASMAAPALNPKAVVVEKDGVAHYTVQFKPLEFQGMVGNLTNLFTRFNDKRVEATKKNIQKGEYNTEMSFNRNALKEKDVPISVWVDVMDQLQGGNPGAGEQDALLRFDWSKAEEIGKAEKPAEHKYSKPQGNEPIQVFVDGKKLSFDSAPMIKNGRTLVPLRAIFESLGAKVTWDQATQSVKAEKDGKTLALTIGSKKATINGAAKALDEPPVIVKGRTLVPLRFIGEGFDNDVKYHQVSGIAVIDIQK